ncbi:DUF2293 domain-containing protein [Streptomyces sp. NPDC003011]
MPGGHGGAAAAPGGTLRGGRRRTRDAQTRSRGAGEIRRLFPGCPGQRAREIAAHASVRGSGRVGRRAARRALSEGTVVSAVVASVRHVDTPYDQLLMSGVARHQARRRIVGMVEAVLGGVAGGGWRRRPGEHGRGRDPRALAVVKAGGDPSGAGRDVARAGGPPRRALDARVWARVARAWSGGPRGDSLGVTV